MTTVATHREQEMTPLERLRKLRAALFDPALCGTPSLWAEAEETLDFIIAQLEQEAR